MKKAAITVLALIFCTCALAQSVGGEFEIRSYTIDGGGGHSSGGNFTLTGTIGQHDASSQSSTGGDFISSGGFWAKVLEMVFSNGFESP